MRRAVIDIGTNTVKLLVADLREGQVYPIVSKDQTTRLGEGVAATQQLSAAAITRTLAAIDGYLADAREHAVSSLSAFATSAARDARNRQEFLAAVRHQCGIDVAVLTGQQEAEFIFCGVASDPVWSSRRLVVLDIGGGSAEIIRGQGGKLKKWASLPLGAVRLTEQFRDRSFAELAAYLRTTLRSALADFADPDCHLIATGGATTTLGRVATGTADHASLTFAEVSGLVAQLNAIPLAERKKVPGIPAERADIIVAGGAVLMFAMEAIGAPALTVSIRNLRYGALLKQS